MGKKINYKDILIYFDGPQLFVGEDQVNTNYLCLLVAQYKEKDKFLCVPISKEKLKSFKLGEIDLKNLYSSPPTEELYLIETESIMNECIEMRKIELQDVPESWFPGEGFFYEEEKMKIDDEKIKKQAKESNRAIIHLTLNPPEARIANKISPDHLAGIVTIFQSLIKYAYKTGSKLMSAQKDKYYSDDIYKLDIASTSPGSFTVHFQNRQPADLFGLSEIERAFFIIDGISEILNDEKELIKKMKEYKGHFAGTYIRFLEGIIKNDMPLSYSWILPGIDKAKTKSIYKKSAKFAYDSLVSTEELSIEELELTGRVIKADDKTGKWTLSSDEDQKEYKGELSKKSKMNLEGIVIKSKIYKFFCEEKIEEILGTGKEKKKIFLIKYELIT
jgi:hypothetical protein